MIDNQVPLTEEHIEIIDNSLGWTDIQWGSTAVFIKGEEYGPLKCYKYFPINSNKT
jgi:hypothetical protein